MKTTNCEKARSADSILGMSSSFNDFNRRHKRLNHLKSVSDLPGYWEIKKLVINEINDVKNNKLVDQETHSQTKHKYIYFDKPSIIRNGDVSNYDGLEMRNGLKKDKNSMQHKKSISKGSSDGLVRVGAPRLENISKNAKILERSANSLVSDVKKNVNTKKQNRIGTTASTN